MLNLLVENRAVALSPIQGAGLIAAVQLDEGLLKAPEEEVLFPGSLFPKVVYGFFLVDAHLSQKRLNLLRIGLAVPAPGADDMISLQL